MLLADLGAEVIKVEPPEGDGTRAWGPPWVGAGRLGPDDPGVAAYYLAINRNKRSIRLDLRTAAGAEVLRGLIGHADVLVENFRVGGFERLGFDDAALEALNRRLVHLAISGYGTSGPDAAAGLRLRDPGGRRTDVDHRLPGRGGWRPGQGWRRDQRRRHRDPGLRGGPGCPRGPRAGPDSPAHDRGQRIDLSLFESTLAVLVNQAQNAFATGDCRPAGAATPIRTSCPTRPLPRRTASSRWRSAANASGGDSARRSTCPTWPATRASPRTATGSPIASCSGRSWPSRFVGVPTAAWLERLEAAEIPCGPIQGVLEALESDQAQAREMTVEVEHPLLGTLRQVGVPFKFGATPATIRTPRRSSASIPPRSWPSSVMTRAR